MSFEQNPVNDNLDSDSVLRRRSGQTTNTAKNSNIINMSSSSSQTPVPKINATGSASSSSSSVINNDTKQTNTNLPVTVTRSTTNSKSKLSNNMSNIGSNVTMSLNPALLKHEKLKLQVKHDLQGVEDLTLLHSDAHGGEDNDEVAQMSSSSPMSQSLSDGVNNVLSNFGNNLRSTLVLSRGFGGGGSQSVNMGSNNNIGSTISNSQSMSMSSGTTNQQNLKSFVDDSQFNEQKQQSSSSHSAQNTINSKRLSSVVTAGDDSTNIPNNNMNAGTSSKVAEKIGEKIQGASDKLKDFASDKLVSGPPKPTLPDNLPPAPSPSAGLFPTQRKSREFYLLWIGIGASASLQSFGASTLMSQGVGIVFFLTWISKNINMKSIVQELLLFIIDLFFREVSSRGTHKLPNQDQPAILCIAPHANQFLDPLVVCLACKSASETLRISFIVAAATMRRRFVGKIARMMDGIAVERPQDVAVQYKVEVVIEEGVWVKKKDPSTPTAQSIDFTKILAPGCHFLAKDLPNSVITEVFDSDCVKLKFPIVEPITNTDSSSQSTYIPQIHLSSFKATSPNTSIDSSSFLTNCIEKLQSNSLVGIFPEGGSHDRTKLLELKPGISLLALEASIKLGTPVPVCPVGLNYFRGHQFRSRVFVDIDDPIYPSQEEILMYSDPAQKRDAVKLFLDRVRNGLSNVTVQTEDFEQLKLYWALRRLYLPTTTTNDSPLLVSYEVKQKMTRAFSEGYNRFKDHPDIKVLIEKVKLYTDLLMLYGIHDYMVAKSFTKITQREDGIHDYMVSKSFTKITQREDGNLNGSPKRGGSTSGSGSSGKNTSVNNSLVNSPVTNTDKPNESESPNDSTIVTNIKFDGPLLAADSLEMDEEQDLQNLRNAQQAEQAEAEAAILASQQEIIPVSVAWLRRSLFFTLIWRLLLLLIFGIVCLPATILALPIAIPAHFISQKKAEEALKKSSVKIKARDVLATWKVLTALILIPTLHIFYTIMIYIIGNSYGTPSQSQPNPGEPYALSFFFFMPFLSYLNIQIGENALRIKRSIRPLIVILWYPESCQKIVELREECVRLTVHAVDEIGWGLRLEEIGIPNNESTSRSEPPDSLIGSGRSINLIGEGGNNNVSSPVDQSEVYIRERSPIKGGTGIGNSGNGSGGKEE